MPRLLLIAFHLLAIVSPQVGLAGDCGANRCKATYVAPSVPNRPAAAGAPTSASSSHAFTAIGGSRVADVNLSPEGLARFNAGDKEEPLPKGCSTAAERAKLFAEPSKPRRGRWVQPLRHRTRVTWESGSGVRREAASQSRKAGNSVLVKTEANPFTRRSVARRAKPMTTVKLAIAAKAARP